MKNENILITISRLVFNYIQSVYIEVSVKSILRININYLIFSQLGDWEIFLWADILSLTIGYN